MTSPATSPTVIILGAMPNELARITKTLSLRREERDGMKLRVGMRGKTRIVAMLIGIGPESARQKTDHVLEVESAGRVLLMGVSGGVAPEMGIGALLVPEEVVDRDSGRRFRPETPPGLTAKGLLQTGATLMTSEETYAALLARGVSAVDMETAAVAEVCERLDRPWSVIRTMSDALAEGIVGDWIMDLLGPDGGPNLAAVAKRVLRHPADMAKLATLGRDTSKAVKVLTRTAVDAIDAWDQRANSS